MILPCLAIAFLLAATVYSIVVSFRVHSEDRPRTWIFPEGVSRPGRIVIYIGSAALLIGLVAWSLSGNGRVESRPSRFLIPEGYVGWVRIEFDTPGYPPLQVQDGAYLLPVPPGGMLRTSSRMQPGWTGDSYYYVSQGGRRRLPAGSQDSTRLIWGKIDGEASSPSGNISYKEFYVGTAQQFKQQLKAEPPATPPANAP